MIWQATVQVFRRDLRLDDLPMLTAALATGRPLVPVFVLDPETEALGAAPKWRLGLGLEAFAARLAQVGSRLVLRRGDALDTLAAENGLSASGLARRAGLDATTFNPSKRRMPDGRARWPSTESIATPALPTSPITRGWSESYPRCVAKSKATDTP